MNLSTFCLNKNKIDTLVRTGWPTCEACGGAFGVLVCEFLDWFIWAQSPIPWSVRAGVQGQSSQLWPGEVTRLQT